MSDHGPTTAALRALETEIEPCVRNTGLHKRIIIECKTKIAKFERRVRHEVAS